MPMTWDALTKASIPMTSDGLAQDAIPITRDAVALATAGEMVLPYDHSIVPQETGYWCGPAATQVVLNSRGIYVAERDLARSIGTHTGGTDYVGLIEQDLDRRVPQAGYVSVYMPNDPPTSAQRQRLWRDLVRGFNAGVDIKEMQATEGFDALIGANRGCYAAFAAVYECAVPVIAAVNGFCLGGGIGLVGNADIIVAADDATFGLPEVDRGALGAATHLARLVPQHKMRAMVYTSAHGHGRRSCTHFGSVLEVVAARRAARRRAARSPAQIAAKSPTVIRAAKESLNGIDPVDVKRSYRFEQGFTFELNLVGRRRRAPRRVRRQARRRTSASEQRRMPDKRMTEDEVVAELRDGMTIGIGGWGSRRKPMALVRAILRST